MKRRDEIVPRDHAALQRREATEPHAELKGGQDDRGKEGHIGKGIVKQYAGHPGQSDHRKRHRQTQRGDMPLRRKLLDPVGQTACLILFRHGFDHTSFCKVMDVACPQNASGHPA